MPYPRFDVDRGTAVAAVDLDLEEAYRISDEFEAPWDPDLSLDACDEIYPGTYALRFTIAEDAGFAYPAELAVMPLSFSGDMGFPAGAQRVTVSGPGTFTTVFSIRALFDAERDGAAAFLVEDLELYFEEECDAVVLDLSGSGLGRDFLSSEPLTARITPMPPLPTAPEGTVQHLAETADWDPQGDHPWRMLANVHGYQGSHFFADRLMLPADGWVMLSVEETLIDGCYAVQSAYYSTSDGLTRARLHQVEAGCEAQFGWTLVESGEDWTVAVAVPDGFDFAGVLRWFDNATPRDPAERTEVAAYYP